MADEPTTTGAYLSRRAHEVLASALDDMARSPNYVWADKAFAATYAKGLRDGTLFLLETPDPRPEPTRWEAGCGTPGRNDGRQLVHTSWSDAAEQLLDWMAELDTLEGHDVSIQARRRREVHGVGTGNEGWIRAIGRAWWIKKVEGDGANS